MPPKRQIPDTLGIRGRAQIILQLLHSLQHEQAMLEAQIIASGGDLEAQAPGKPRTFAEERERLERAITEVARKHAHLMPAVGKLLANAERDQAAREQAEEAAAAAAEQTAD